MADRPYFSFSAVDLQAEAKKHWESLPRLTEIWGELKHRTTARAQRMERDIVQRILALGGTVDGPVGRSDTRESAPGPSSDAKDDGCLRELTMRAVRAEQQVRELEERLQAAEAEVSRLCSSMGDGSEDLYARIGLHASCPDFVLSVVRRAYRKEYHPDALSDRPPAEQLAAQERFKEHEAIFDEIEQLRQ